MLRFHNITGTAMTLLASWVSDILVDNRQNRCYTNDIIRKREDRPCVRTVILGVDVEAARTVLTGSKIKTQPFRLGFRLELSTSYSHARHTLTPSFRFRFLDPSAPFQYVGSVPPCVRIVDFLYSIEFWFRFSMMSALFIAGTELTIWTTIPIICRIHCIAWDLYATTTW